ncbi:YugN family protein [Thalassobacillus sp. CUG 92003]|uniref:YugN family protein n=1 Tax=Thalassobacillus sp. CUG 92003 TaxID=2736641 RepID=UPI0015E678AC|nr:YugN family protein [Thalassobacillus sp. CUG 92003]
MKLENTGIEGLVLEYSPLTHLMEKNGFMLGGSWDYERVTYDYKINSPEKNITYYLRIQGYAIEGDVDRKTAVIELLPPLIGKHYYPHGVEYGEQEEFSSSILDKAYNLLSNLKEEISHYHQS